MRERKRKTGKREKTRRQVKRLKKRKEAIVKHIIINIYIYFVCGSEFATI